jgi:hypothetical protein
MIDMTWKGGQTKGFNRRPHCYYSTSWASETLSYIHWPKKPGARYVASFKQMKDQEVAERRRRSRKEGKARSEVKKTGAWDKKSIVSLSFKGQK